MTMVLKVRKSLLWLVIVLVAVGAVYFSADKVGKHTYRIDNGSMVPTLPVGTRVITLPVKTHLEPRDIITFESGGGQVTTHTFIGYAKDGSLQTKGDANRTPDMHYPPLKMSDVKGKVIVALTPFKLRVLGLIGALLLVIWLIPTKRREEVEKSESANDGKPSVPTPA